MNYPHLCFVHTNDCVCDWDIANRWKLLYSVELITLLIANIKGKVAIANAIAQCEWDLNGKR